MASTKNGPPLTNRKRGEIETGVYIVESTPKDGKIHLFKMLSTSTDESRVAAVTTMTRSYEGTMMMLW